MSALMRKSATPTAKYSSSSRHSGYKAAGPTIEKYLDMNPEAVKPEDLQDRDQRAGGEEK